MSASAFVVAVLSVQGAAPVTTTFYAPECKPAMEQVVKSYGLVSYIKSWSNSSMKAANGGMYLTVTCSILKKG